MIAVGRTVLPRLRAGALEVRPGARQERFFDSVQPGPDGNTGTSTRGPSAARVSGAYFFTRIRSAGRFFSCQRVFGEFKLGFCLVKITGTAGAADGLPL